MAEALLLLDAEADFLLDLEGLGVECEEQRLDLIAEGLPIPRKLLLA